MKFEAYKSDFKGLIPDDEDRENIQHLIERYETKFPYPNVHSIKYVTDEARKVVTEGGMLKKKGKKLDLKYRLTMPRPFHLLLMKGYPALMVDKVQFEWFLENFPIFDLTK